MSQLVNEVNVEAKKNNGKKIRIILSMVVIGIFLLASGILCWNKLNQKFSHPELDASHVLVCDNPMHDSEFDTWLKENIGLSWVPTYVIVNDNKVIGMIKGGIPEESFTGQLGSYLVYNQAIAELPNISVTNLAGERKPVSDYFGQGMYILEISWIDCHDCIEQDEKYTTDVYKKYGTDIIYRYYIKSELGKVEEKYK